MSTIRPKDTDALSTLASNHEIMVDGPDGFGTLLRDTFLAQVAALIVANPTTYKIATLDGADKLTSSQDPSQPLSYIGTHNASTNSPTLIDGTGTAGDTYQINVAGTRDYGSGSLTLAVGDALVYNGTIWQQVAGVANILNGISTPAAAQTALEVISADESAEIAGTKLAGPALHFSTNDYIEFADDGRWTFTDGTNDLAFTLSGWVYVTDNTNDPIICKYGTSASVREYLLLANSDRLYLYLNDGTIEINAYAANLPTNQWVHVAAVYSGADSGSFASAADNVTFYFNAKAQTTVASNNASYAGMSDTTQPVWIGRYSNTYANLSIGSIMVHNRALTASEVVDVKDWTSGFSDEWGGALGGLETSDFSAGVDGYSTNSGTVTGNVDAILSVDDTLRHTDAGSGTVVPYVHNASITIPAGKRVRHKFDYYIPAANTSFTALSLWLGGTTKITNLSTTGSWATYEGEFVNTTGSDVTLRIYAGTGTNYTAAGESFYLKNIVTTQTGTLADLRAEDFNESAGKLLDRSSNNFVGTNNGATLVGNQRHISADTIDLKNLPTSSAGLSAGEVWSNSGVLTVV